MAARIFKVLQKTAKPPAEKQNLHKTDVMPAKAGIQNRLRMDKQCCVYIMASKRNGTLYTGVTSDLVRRIYEHKNDIVEGFTKKYCVHDLVYYEVMTDMMGAIQREKCIKKWKRAWKIELIEKNNPQWKDLYEEIGL